MSLLILLGMWPHHTASGILVPQPGIKPKPPSLEAHSFNTWMARDIGRNLLWKTVLAVSSKVTFTTQLLSSIYSQEVNTSIHTETWTQLFIIALIHNSPKVEATSLSIIW